ncbi:UvrD-helicase domain-containing protein [Motilimonas pumila]|uniref:UvrD-like helicase ATP-binding domain-containing protein n=1 Tax=Motilimonas pumila TaxID=2303987 RepID=A0A418YFL1_9GAMM|nr:UvrD-helicase domain-containing protein [Motilimonas pumila]RJG48177.1 hypothetical protein D1Z90_08915 [Motilimonas pumila]
MLQPELSKPLTEFSLAPSWFGKIAARVKPQQCLSFNAKGVVVFSDDTYSTPIYVINWQDLLAPVYFQQAWLGCRCYLMTNEGEVTVKWQGYKSPQRFEATMLKFWIASHQAGLAQLVAKVTPYYQRRYVRNSHFSKLSYAVNAAHQRWLPVYKQPNLPQDLTTLLSQLSAMVEWQAQGVDALQQRFSEHQLAVHQSLFDSVEKQALTLAQRQACVMDDDNNLLLAGAGSGKTSVMIARMVYLIRGQQASANQILCLAYGKQAATEMQERLALHADCKAVTCRTFHSLALHIIHTATGRSPEVSELALSHDAKIGWLSNNLQQILTAQSGQKALLPYFCFWLDTQSALTLNGLEASCPIQRKVANYLFSQSIRFELNASGPFNDGQLVDIFLPTHNAYIDCCHADSARLAVLKARQSQAKEKDINYLVLILAAGDEMKKLTSLISKLKKQLAQWQALLHEPICEDFLRWLFQSDAFHTLTKQLADELSAYDQALQAERLDDIKQNVHTDPVATTRLKWLKQLQVRYQKTLKQQGQVDFDSMINQATQLVTKGKFSSLWSHLLVDEFQDIAPSRAKLLQALQQNHGDASLFAVGDDWQAIYGFNGADVRLTTEFERYFGKTRQHCLDQTFRLNNQVANVATRFVMANPQQINKQITAKQQIEGPQVFVHQFSLPKAQSLSDEVDNKQHGQLKAIKRCLNLVKKQHGKAALTIYLLARFKHQLPNTVNIETLKQAYPQWQFCCDTVHGAKGKEADVSIVLAMNQGKFGFPAAQQGEPLMAQLLPLPSGAQSEEERRLFYVALTRAKLQAYLLADKLSPSEYVQELLSGDYPEVATC